MKIKYYYLLRQFSIVTIVITILMLFNKNVKSQNTGTRSDLYITDGSINTVHLKNNELYIGGNFNKIGPRTGSFTLLDSLNSSVKNIYPKIKGSVWTIESDGNLGWYIGGDFYVEKSDRRHLIHVDQNAELDLNFNPNVDAGVTFIKRNGNVLYIGGFFTKVSNESHQSIAAINSTTGNALSFNAKLNSHVNWMEVNNNYLYVAGTFTEVNDSTRKYLVRFNTLTNELDPWNLELNEAVNCMQLNNDKLYIAGFFDTIGSIHYDRLAVIDLQSNAINSIGISVQGFGISSMTILNNILYLGGYFDSINNINRSNLAAINLIDNTLNSWNPTLKGNANFIINHSNKIIIGGVFDSVGTFARNHLAEIDAITGIPTNWNPDPDKFIFTIASNSDGIAVGGLFTSINRTNRKNLASINNSTGVVSNWINDINGDVTNITSNDDKLFISGNFNLINNSVRRSIAAFDLSSKTLSSWNVQLTDTLSYISSMLVHNNELFIAGAFDGIGNFECKNIAKLNTTDGNVINWIHNTDAYVNQIKINNNKIYLSGDFNYIDSISRAYIARIDLSTNSVDQNWEPELNGSAMGVDFYSNLVFVYGWFSEVNGSFEQGISAVNESNAELVGQNLTIDGIITTTAIKNGILYIGGSFFMMNGDLRFNLGAFVIQNQNTAVWKYETDFPVNNLYMTDDYLYACGSFESVNNEAHTAIVGLPYVISTGIDRESNTKDLMNIYPNPFNDQITLNFQLQQKSNTKLEIIDIYGKRIKLIDIGSLDKGENTYKLKLNELDSNQIYILNLYANHKRLFSKKLIKN